MKAFVIGDAEQNETKKFLVEEVCRALEENDIEVVNAVRTYQPVQLYRVDTGKTEIINTGRTSGCITDLKFALDGLYDADVIVPCTYQRTPEIYFAAGVGRRGGKIVVPYWNAKGKPPEYGFYKLFAKGVQTPEDLVERIKTAKPTELRKVKAPPFNGKLKVYIAGDVRERALQKMLFLRELAVKELGHIGLNPPRVVDDIYNIEKYYEVDRHICEVPAEKRILMGEGTQGIYKRRSKIPGAERCFRAIDRSHAVWTAIYKPDNTGPWIESGYASTLGIPIIGYNAYTWKKTLGGEILDELGKYNERFGIPRDRWIVETKKDLKWVLDRLAEYYAAKSKK